MISSTRQLTAPPPPLAAMFFSDTSRATKSSGATQEQYTESQTELFTVNSVGALCGSLKVGPTRRWKSVMACRRRAQIARPPRPPAESSG